MGAKHFPVKGDILHSQDSGHTRRLELTYNDFKTCFPNIDIKVNLDFIQQFPRSLTVVKKVNGKTRYIEVYTKEVDVKENFNYIYQNQVKCITTKSSGVFLRINTFELKGKTVKIHSSEDEVVKSN